MFFGCLLIISSILWETFCINKDDTTWHDWQYWLEYNLWKQFISFWQCEWFANFGKNSVISNGRGCNWLWSHWWIGWTLSHWCRDILARNRLGSIESSYNERQKHNGEYSS